MKEKIYELRLKNKTINEISEELNCAKSTVSYHLNNLGLGGNIATITSNFSEYDKVLKLKNSGYTNNEIYDKTSLSKDKVLKILRVNNLSVCNTVLKYVDINVDAIRSYYVEVSSLRLTAKKFNLSYYKTKSVVKDLIKPIKKYKTIEEKKQARKKSVIDWRRRTKEKLVEYKGGECERCGYHKSIQVLQFHHIDPNKKDFIIGGRSYSFERMKKEVDKCMMVCANCHIEIHEELRNE